MKTTKLNTFEITKLDLEQMTESEKILLTNELLVTFATENKVDKKSFWDKVSAIDNNFIYKLYRHDGRSFISTNNPNIKKSRLELSSNLEGFEFSSFKKLNSDIVFGKDYFKGNGRYYRLISLLEMPNELSPSELDIFGDYCVFFKPISKEKSHHKAKVSRNSHYSSLISAGPKDLESELSHFENEKMLSDLIQGTQSMFRVEVFFIVKADSEKELSLKTEQLVSDLRVSGANPFIEAHSLYSLVESIFADTQPKFLRAMDKNSEYLFNLLPLHNDYLMDEGISLVANTGKKVKFNLFDSKSPNFNVLISGESGSGKSMFTQKLLKEMIDSGASALVIDLERSFKKLADYYVAKTFSKSFNPMAFRCPHYLKEFCMTFIDRGELTRKDEGVLFNSIKDALDNHPLLSFESLLSKLSNGFF